MGSCLAKCGEEPTGGRDRKRLVSPDLGGSRLAGQGDGTTRGRDWPVGWSVGGWLASPIWGDPCGGLWGRTYWEKTLRG